MGVSRHIQPLGSFQDTNRICSMAYMINENSIQFNIVSKNLGCDRMAFFLNEAAGDIRDIMMPTISNKAKL
jgi:carnitine O-acetyltransferase